MHDVVLCTASDATMPGDVCRLVASIRRVEPTLRVSVDAIDWEAAELARLTELGPEIHYVSLANRLPEIFADRDRLIRIAAQDHRAKNWGKACTPQALIAAAWRLVMIGRVMGQTGSSVCWLDADCLVRLPLRRLFEAMANYDVGTVLRDGKRQPCSRVLSSIVMVNPTPGGARFLDALPEAYLSCRDHAGSLADQEAIYLALKTARPRVGPISQERYADSTFSSSAAIWHRKFQGQRDPAWLAECAKYEERRQETVDKRRETKS